MAIDPAGISGRRIALVLGTSTGGVGRHVRALAVGLQNRGAQVTVCAPASVDEAFGFSGLGAGFVPVAIGKGWRFFDPRTVARLRAAVGDVELVHAHGLRPSIAATAARRGGQPLVITWHNAVLGSAVHRQVLRRGERAVARGSDLVLGASQDLVDRARALGARDARLTMLPAPDLPPPSGARAEIRDRLGIGSQVVVLTVARLVPQKRLDVLVDAASLLARAGVDVEVLIVGGGRLQLELSEQIQRTGAPVRLLGERFDVGDLLVAADVFALSSAWEARSFAVQEAMLRDCAVVVPRVGGLPELVGDSGVIVEPADAQALADGIRRLVDDPGQRAALATAAKTRAAGWPAESTVIDETIAAYLGWIAPVR
ncbi:MAG TPA: glycosyltransferase family 4 protein [Mycobacteriales bacterium]|nr:glycosyltransferase family 4 protein [Mycobacteriales bacterium]